MTQNAALKQTVRPRTEVERAVQRAKSKVVALRNKWESRVRGAAFKMQVLRRPHPKSPDRVIYFIDRGAATWFETMANEFSRMEEFLRHAKISGRSRPRVMWTPSLIRDPLTIKVRRTPARSVRTVSKAQAKDFLRKVDVDRSLPAGKYVQSSRTGEALSLRVVYADNRKETFACHEWSVCLWTSDIALGPVVKESRLMCNDNVPRRLAGLENGERIDTETRIASHGRTVLFVRTMPNDDEGWD